MIMDAPSDRDLAPESVGLKENAWRPLEFHLIREKLAAHTSFAPARELALELAPGYDDASIQAQQQETTEARQFLEQGLTLDLSGATDPRPALQRAALGGTLTGEELRSVSNTLKVARKARTVVMRQRNMPALAVLARDLPVLEEVEARISSAIGKSGDVLDNATPKLKEIREESRTAHERLTASLERTLRRLQRQEVLQEPIVTQRSGRMVLLVKSEMRKHLSGIVHDVSDSGATVFVEPMTAVGLGNRWRELSLAEEREVDRVLRLLSEVVAEHCDELLGAIELLAHLDLAIAKASYSIATDAIQPTIVEADHQYVHLTASRHPLLKGDVVPITMTLGGDCRLLVVTGPNAGGKTVALKTVGLLVLMAQAGLHVPAEEASLSLFDGVFADIGDQQSIQRSLSTFSSHIENLKSIMDRATGKSLVLIDELGASTDPEEGAALAKAILRRFSRQGGTLVATTHQRDVAAFVQEQPGMMNASVELDPQTLAPTYRLSPGLPGRSYALTIASKLGLDTATVEEAQALLSPAQKGAESLLKELQEERNLAVQKRREAEEAMAEAGRQRRELDQQLASVEETKAEILEEERTRLRKKAEDLAQRLRAVAKALERPPEKSEVKSELPHEKSELKETRLELKKVEQELKSADWRPAPSKLNGWKKDLESGDWVHLRGIPQPVEVITPPGDGDSAEVLLGTMRAHMPVSQLERLADVHTPRVPAGTVSRPRKRQANTELDLHGVRVEEGLERIDEFLSDATVDGLSSVRILHGVGTGALRSAVRELVAHHPLVKSYKKDENTLNDGVTIVELV